MQQTFDDFWNSIMKYVTGWNNLLLRGMPEHIFGVLMAANEVPAVRKPFAEGFNNPADYFDWLVSPDKAAAYLEEVAPERVAAQT
jgi:hypothetical protein